MKGLTIKYANSAQCLLSLDCGECNIFSNEPLCLIELFIDMSW